MQGHLQAMHHREHLSHMAKEGTGDDQRRFARPHERVDRMLDDSARCG